MVWRVAIVAFGVLTGCFAARGQAYAPNTEFHDPVQRMFVIEAARVLAWWTDPTAANFTEVTYDVTVRADQTTIWSIFWLGPNGKPAKTATITYPGKLLKEGPAFYRTVFEQLWAGGWKDAPKAAEVTDSFWRGAAKAGLSREESVSAALRIVAAMEKKPAPEHIPELAGLLSHAALPGFGGNLSLDRVLLARAAAWLALAEYASEKKPDQLWAPLLFQAGRERFAAKLWNEAKPEKPTAAQAGWNLWLSKPASKDVFLFATESTNLPLALPMLAYDVRVNGTGPALGGLITDLAGRTRLPSLHNYSPLFNLYSTVAGAQTLEGRWPVLQRMAWVNLMAAYPARTNEYRAYLGTLRTVTNNMARQAAWDGPDPSLRGFPNIAPLLKLAQTEGVGKLLPLAVVSSRDLLSYGWEATGLQIGARCIFLHDRWNKRDAANQARQTVLAEVEGLAPFFERYERSNVSDYRDWLKRLQLVEGLMHLTGFSPPPAEGDNAARHFARRGWLRPGDFEWQARALWDAEATAELATLMHDFQDEGGPLAAAAVVAYLANMDDATLRVLPQGKELQASFLDSLPSFSPFRLAAVCADKFRDLDTFERGQEYEKMYWQNPDSGLEEWVVFNYIVSGSFRSAKRFYSQARLNFQDPMMVALRHGNYMFLLGYALRDDPLRKQVLKDIDPDCPAGLTLRMYEAALRDDPAELEKVARVLSPPPMKRRSLFEEKTLTEFLPMLPALRDPKDPGHVDAVEYFEDFEPWPILRFTWAEKFKLTSKEAAMFVTTRRSERLTTLMLACLEKDLAKASEAFTKVVSSVKSSSEDIVFAACLYSRLQPLSGPHEEPDLKPPGAISIRQAVLEKLHPGTRAAK